MNKINGKTFYVAFGYFDEEKFGNTYPDVKDIEPIYVESKRKKNDVYVDDSDPENVIVLPLFPINEIQKSNNKYKFRILINPNKIDFSKKSVIKINVVGLFCELTKDGVQTIKNISFYKVSGLDSIYTKKSKSSTFVIEEDAKHIEELTKDE